MEKGLLMIRVLLGAFILLFATPAYAQSCYSSTEAEAEQGIRIHSELMVIGLNCQAMGARRGMNLYGDYRQFTSDHSDLFARYETILMKFFESNNQNPEAELNTLRTKFANKISNDAADLRPDVFCSKYAPRILKAAEMDRTAVRKWAATIYPSHPVSRPLCEG